MTATAAPTDDQTNIDAPTDTEVAALDHLDTLDGVDAIGQLDAEVITTIPWDQIGAHPANPRGDLDTDGDLEDLAASIATRGLIQPLVVLPANHDGTHLLAAGHRRHAALGLLIDRGQVPADQPVNVIVRDLDAAALLETFLVENGRRRSLGPVAEARTLAALIDATTLTLNDAAARIGRRPGWVADRLRLLTLPPVGLEALDSGALTFGAALKLTEAAARPDIITNELDRLIGNHHGTPVREWHIDAVVNRARNAELIDAAVDEHEAAGRTVRRTVLDGAVTVDQLGVDLDEHMGLACHVVVVTAPRWGGDTAVVAHYCTDPASHDYEPEATVASWQQSRETRIADQDARRDHLRTVLTARTGFTAAAATAQVLRLVLATGNPVLAADLLGLAPTTEVDVDDSHETDDEVEDDEDLGGFGFDAAVQAVADYAAESAANLARAAFAAVMIEHDPGFYGTGRNPAFYEAMAATGYTPTDNEIALVEDEEG